MATSSPTVRGSEKEMRLNREDQSTVWRRERGIWGGRVKLTKYGAQCPLLRQRKPFAWPPLLVSALSDGIDLLGDRLCALFTVWFLIFLGLNLFCNTREISQQSLGDLFA